MDRGPWEVDRGPWEAKGGVFVYFLKHLFLLPHFPGFDYFS